MLYEFRYEKNGVSGQISVRAETDDEAWAKFREHWEGDEEEPPAGWIAARWAEAAR